MFRTKSLLLLALLPLLANASTVTIPLQTVPAGATAIAIDPPAAPLNLARQTVTLADQVVTPPPPPPPPNGFTADPGFALSGTIAQGKQVTITGPNFGAHGNYNPGSYTWQGNLYLNALVQDFSTGVFTQGLSQDETGATWTVQKSGCPANSAQCALWKGSTSRQGVAEFSPKVSTGTIYADFKFKPQGNCKGMKLFRTWGSADSIYLSTCSDLSVRGGDDSGNDVYGGVSNYSSTAFNHVEVFADKTFTPYVNTQKQWFRSWNSGNVVGHTIDFGNLLEVGDSAVFANLYLDYTYARCELADAPTWSAAKHHEVQVPVAWGAKAVTLALNGGEIGLPGNYLYCFDASNAPTRVGQVAAH